jgi:hypothetical protein
MHGSRGHGRLGCGDVPASDVVNRHTWGTHPPGQSTVPSHTNAACLNDTLDVHTTAIEPRWAEPHAPSVAKRHTGASAQAAKRATER